MTKQKIAVFDIDGTIFRSGLYREILFELIRVDKIPKNMKKIFSSHELEWKIRKNDDSFALFDGKIVESFKQALKYLDPLDYNKACQSVLKQKGHYCYRFTKNLTKRLQREGYFLITISGSQDEIVQDFAKLHNFDLAVGCVYERDANNNFTGREIRETYKNKHLILQDLLDWDKFTLKDSYAVGDTMGDFSLLDLVDNPIAFNPSKELFNEAKKKDWSIVIERKNVIYQLEKTNQGYLLK